MLRIGDSDKGYDALRKRLAEIKNRKVTIGLHGKDDARAGEISNVALATAHEYGTEDLPERSFLRRAMDEHGADFAKYARQLAVMVVDGKLTTDRALGLLGAMVKAVVVSYFDRNLIRPDISEATKERKGSSTVLLDTASMKQAIDYVVRQLMESAL